MQVVVAAACCFGLRGVLGCVLVCFGVAVVVVVVAAPVDPAAEQPVAST